MSLLHPQISAATQEHIEKQLATIQAFSSAAFGGLEKIVALNVATAKQAFERISTTTEQVLAVKAPHELLTHAKEQSAPQIERLLAYGRELATISAAFREEVLHLVSNAQDHVAATPVVAHQEVKPVTILTSEPVATPAKPSATTTVKKVAPKAEPKLAPKAPLNKQLPLLAEAEAKPAKASKPSAKVTAKPASKKEISGADKPATNVVAKSKATSVITSATTSAPKLTVKQTVKPVVVPASKDTVKPSNTSTQTKAKSPVKKIAVVADSDKPVTAPAAVSASKSVTPHVTTEKAAPAISTAAKTEATSNAATVPVKKSAVKFPAALTQSLQGDKPAFPRTGNRPAFKAKSSPATGAKKRVRQ